MAPAKCARLTDDSVQPFGRSCLIPQLSYLSEAAASLLDRRLGSYIVPRTEVVKLGSPSFFYDYAERAKKGGKWRLKEGSFQAFLKGYQGASYTISLSSLIEP